jgi:hypothetical protein
VPSTDKSDAQLHTTALFRARNVLNDETEPYRNSDTNLIGYINEFYTEVARLRPDLVQDLLYDEAVDFPPYYTSMQDLKGTRLLISVEYFTALGAYLTGRASMRDDEFESDALAVRSTGLAKQILMGAA